MSLLNQTFIFADSTLILGHRNSEWTGHGPILEQDIAISNIALDLIGQARNYYQYAAELIGGNTTEDTLAFMRNANEFKNFLLVEQPNGDWGKTILRQFFFSSWQYLAYQLPQSSDRLNAIAEKSLKEVTYHLRWSSEWVIRLGQGTDESHERMTKAIAELYPFTGEFLDSSVRDPWRTKVAEVLAIAGIETTDNSTMVNGPHTRHLEILLEEMQYMQRTYPGVDW